MIKSRKQYIKLNQSRNSNNLIQYQTQQTKTHISKTNILISRQDTPLKCSAIIKTTTIKEHKNHRDTKMIEVLVHMV